MTSEVSPQTLLPSQQNTALCTRHERIATVTASLIALRNLTIRSMLPIWRYWQQRAARRFKTLLRHHHVVKFPNTMAES